MKHNVFSRFLLVIIAWMTLDIVGLIPQSALAQDSIPPEPQLIMDGIRPTNLGWADQENILAFSDASLPSGQVINEFDTWHQFDLDSGQITQSYIWPLQPAVPSQIEDQIVPSTLLFRSPTGRYYIFVAPNNGPETWFKNELKVYDTVQNIVINTGVPTGGVTDRVGTLDIIWSTDTKFIISTLPEEGGIPTLPNLYYATIHSSSITIKPMLEVGSQGQTFIIYDVIDFASDGENILIQGGIREEFKSFFGIWNLRTPSELIVVPETEVNRRELRGAQFTSTNGTEFVFVDDQRLGRYDVINRTSSTISTSVNGQNYRFAEFSNNGDMLALADDEAVYWLDLRPAQIVPTPVLIPSSTCDPQAQETSPPQPQLIIDGIRPTNLGWANNESSFTFLNATVFGRGLTLESDEWFLFHTEDATLVRKNVWPLQPNLSLQVDIEPNSPIFISPSGRYMVYSPPSTSEKDIEGGSFVEIYDTETNSVIETNTRSGRSSGVIGSFDVIWGSDAAFVVKTAPIYSAEPPFPIFNYVSLSNPALDRLLSIFAFDSRTFLVSNVLDVSPSGSQVLMKGGFIGEGNSFLVIWDAQNPNDLGFMIDIQIDVESVLAAQFTAFDGTEFLFFNDQGLGHYDVLNATSEIINRDVTADDYRFAEFSNRGEMLALADDEAVYWLDLRPAQVTPTSVPNSHLQPTSVCSPIRIATDDIVPSNLQWLDEGLQLTFFDAASLGSYVRLEIDEESWYKFDVDHQTLSRSNKWLAQPEIPDDLLNDIYSNSLAFLTPDGQYLIYASKPHPDIGENESFISIYNVRTGLILDTDIPSGVGRLSTGFTRLIWGGHDRFVLSITPSNGGLPTPPILYYIDLSTEPISVKLIIGLDLGGYQPFYVVDVFDVSADGMHLLLKGGFIGEGITYLAIWDVQSPNELTYIPDHQVIVESILVAQFSNFDGTEFLFFNDQGLGRYDVLNATSEIINRGVTADDYRFAEFSNSGEMLALADDEAVYWLDLRPAQVMPDLCP